MPGVFDMLGTPVRCVWLLNEREVYYPERVMSDSGDGSERSVRTW